MFALSGGTWWTRHTLGWSERHRLAVGGRAEPLEVSPPSLDGSGRVPVNSGAIPWASAHPAVSSAPVTGAATEGRKIKPEFTGTLPKEAQHGEHED